MAVERIEQRITGIERTGRAPDHSINPADSLFYFVGGCGGVGVDGGTRGRGDKEKARRGEILNEVKNLPSGEITSFGGKLVKAVTGYNLVQHA